MKHIDWLHPEHIILQNSTECDQEFTKDMRSKKFKLLRLLEFKDRIRTQNYIRYVLDGEIKWFHCDILYKKSNDYFLRIDKMIETEHLEKEYIPLNREELINKLLK